MRSTSFCMYRRALTALQPQPCMLAPQVNFVRGCLMGGIIRVTTFRDTTAFFNAFMEATKAHMASPPALPPAGNSVVCRGPGVPRGGAAGSSGGSMHLSPPGVGAAGGRETLAPVRRQLKVLCVFLILVGSIVHQLSLHNELDIVRHMLSERLT
jgi:hypothetical protein